MNHDNNRQNAHNEIDHIFKDLLPTRNMAERPAQVALCHQMLNAMLEGGIALCDAGTGIGKTYAYLVAGTVYSRFRAACGLERKPILVSTSSIALQTAARDEYLPLLSDVLTEDGMLLRRRAQEIVDLTEKTAKELTHGEEAVSGEISIGCGETQNMKPLAEIMASFQRKYPDVSFHIYTAIADDVKERLENGTLDMGLLLEPVEISRYHYVRMPLRENGRC